MQQGSSWWNWWHPGEDEIHPWRWRALAAWIIIFTAVTIFTTSQSSSSSDQAVDASKKSRIAIQQNKRALGELRENKASIGSLEKTNCNLKIFLLIARKARFDAAQHEPEPKKSEDKAAAQGYKNLADNFVVTSNTCKIPKRLILKGD